MFISHFDRVTDPSELVVAVRPPPAKDCRVVPLYLDATLELRPSALDAPPSRSIQTRVRCIVRRATAAHRLSRGERRLNGLLSLPVILFTKGEKKKVHTEV